jgi:hypothetical protein
MLVAAGCAPAFVPLDREEMARLKSEPEIRVVTYQPPRFLYQMPNSLFGGPGAFGSMAGGFAGAAGDPGSRVYAIDTSLADPAIQVRDVFLKGLAGRLDGARLIQAGEPLPDDDVQAVAARLGGGVVLDFKTTTWGLFAGWGASTPHQIGYFATARLVRLDEKRILWHGQCRYDGADQRAHLDSFQNADAVLKEKFAEAADACAKALLAQFFGAPR